jgi:hypothetical protein
MRALSLEYCGLVSVYSMYVFFVSCLKVSAGLADLFKVAAIAFYFVYTAIVIFVEVYVFYL